MSNEELPKLSAAAQALIESERQRPPPPAGSAGTGTGTKVIAVAVAAFFIGGVVGAGAFGLLREDPPARIEYVKVEVPVEKIVEVPAPRVDVEPPREQKKPLPRVRVVESPKGAPPPPVVVAEAKPTSKSTLEAERTLLERARTALGRGQPQDARAALERHAQEFPEGQLREEREVLFIQMLVSSRAFEEAREKARRFKDAHPKSILLPTVDAVLEQTQ